MTFNNNRSIHYVYESWLTCQYIYLLIHYKEKKTEKQLGDIQHYLQYS